MLHYDQDHDGFFIYCGWCDAMLMVSGMCVSPFEVEGALCTRPGVLELRADLPKTATGKIQRFKLRAESSVT